MAEGEEEAPVFLYLLCPTNQRYPFGSCLNGGPHHLNCSFLLSVTFLVLNMYRSLRDFYLK